MANEEKGADCYSSAGNDWELVSLTESTYAAAPGPILPLLDNDKSDVGYFDPKYDSPAAMVMSGHFNLPMEGDADPLKQPDCKGGADEVCHKQFSPAMMAHDTHDPNRSYAKGCESKLNDDLPSFNLLDNQKSVFLDDVVFGDGKGPGGHSLAGEEEQNMFHSSGFDIPDAGSDVFRSAHRAANAATAGTVDPACPTGDDPVGSVAGSGDAHISTGHSKIPCKAWWKKTFSFLCNNAKESVTFRFIFVAATIVGIAILGQHWQREKLQRQQFRLQFNVDSEVSFNLSDNQTAWCIYVVGSLLGGQGKRMRRRCAVIPLRVRASQVDVALLLPSRRAARAMDADFFFLPFYMRACLDWISLASKSLSFFAVAVPRSTRRRGDRTTRPVLLPPLFLLSSV